MKVSNEEFVSNETSCFQPLFLHSDNTSGERGLYSHLQRNKSRDRLSSKGKN